MENHRIKGLILDMDGVLWRGPQSIGDLPSIFSKISKSGLGVVFATNNATRTVNEYVETLGAFGVKVLPEQLITSGIATGYYLKTKYNGNVKIFLIGENGLVSTLTAFGIILEDHDPQAVVVGLDRGLTYQKLEAATRLINSGCEFIGTNPDPTLPTPEGAIPGAGAILAAIQMATGVSPIIMGKPYPELFKIALKRLAISPGEALVVGDRIDTDIAGGIAAGCLTALVLSGVTDEQAASRSNYRPTLIAKDLESLILDIT
jgi:4-nitrophenyl phosphatase